MDTLTHALSGALLARATAPAVPRPDQLPQKTRLWLGFWAAAFPDGDFVANLIDPLTYLATHRGITHSLVMLPLWALGLALACTWLWRRRYPWQAFAGVIALGIGIHIAGDVITAFGTMILAPFSDWRAAIPTTFIIDPYFTAILFAGLLASWRWRASRRPALAGLAVLAAYVGAQGLLLQRAVALGEAHAVRHGYADARVEAIPQPFSPFHWMVVVARPAGYELAYVSLLRRSPPAEPPPDAHWFARVYATYRPADAATWVRVPRFGASAEAHLAESVWYSQVLTQFRSFATSRRSRRSTASTTPPGSAACGSRTCASRSPGAPCRFATARARPAAARGRWRGC
jgi:inner membrane protein